MSGQTQWRAAANKEQEATADGLAVKITPCDLPATIDAMPDGQHSGD